VTYDIAPFAILSVVFAFIAAFGKERVIGSSSTIETVLMAFKSTAFYLQKLILPTDLSPIYPYVKAITVSSPDFYIPIIIVIACALIALASLRKTRWVAIASGLFLITLAPSFLNFHKGISVFFAVDRYAYLPMIWLIVLLGAGLSELSDRVWNRTPRQIAVVGLAMFIATLSAMSMRQARVWANDEVLFSHVLTLYPESVSARTSLSAVYREQGRELDEIEVLEEGLKITKEVAYYTGIGSVAARQGKLEEAETLYGQARIVDPSNPEPFFFLGALEEQRGNPDRAEGYYKEAIRFDESYVAAYNNLGAIYVDHNKFSEAEDVFRTALRWNPNSMEALYNLFQVLEYLKKKEEAFPYLLKAYELNPENTDIAMSVAYRYWEKGNTSKAITVLKRLLAVDPENPGATRFLMQLEPSAPQQKSGEQNAKNRRQERLKERSR
jgi:tetratricopeptide (TPR) repeat protein